MFKLSVTLLVFLLVQKVVGIWKVCLVPPVLWFRCLWEEKRERKGKGEERKGRGRGGRKKKRKEVKGKGRGEKGKRGKGNHYRRVLSDSGWREKREREGKRTRPGGGREEEKERGRKERKGEKIQKKGRMLLIRGKERKERGTMWLFWNASHSVIPLYIVFVGLSLPTSELIKTYLYY